MIKEMTITGFRGYRLPTTIGFALPNGKPGSGYSVFVGANNAGKTTALEAIRYYKAPSSNISFSEGKRNPNSTSPSRVNIKYVSETNEEYEIKTVAEGGSQVFIVGSPNTTMVPYLLQSRRYSDYEMHNPYANQSRGDFVINQMINSRNRSPNLSMYEQRIFRWREHKREFDIVLHQIICEPFDWLIEQNENGTYYIKMIFADGSISHAREGVGDGYWCAFTIADALYDSSPGSIIAIDEPELSLHPSMRKRVMKLFETYSQDRQIIVATHSQYFISFVAIENGGSVIRFSKNGSGDILIGAIDDEDRDFIKSIQLDIFNPHVLGLKAKELFFSEEDFIITEGQEDVIIMPKICNKIGLSFDIDFFGWGAGGAGNIKKILHMLSNLNYRKITAIYDGDKQVEYDECKNAFPQYNIQILPADDIRDKEEYHRNAKVGVVNDAFEIKADLEDQFRMLIENIKRYHDDITP